MKDEHQSMGKVLSFPWIERETEKFRAYLRGEKKTPRTEEIYLKTLKDFLEWIGKSPEQLTKYDMQQWKQHLANKYCENTMKLKIAAMKQYTQCILERPDLRIRSPKGVFKPKIALTKEEIERILQEARKPSFSKDGSKNNANTNLRDYAMLCILYYGMLRATECANVRKSDLDLDNKKLRVFEGKGKNFRMINLTECTVQAIREYIENGRPKAFLPKYENSLFLSIQGESINRMTVYDIVKKVGFKAGITKTISPHVFRHTAITHMSEEGIPATLIQLQSGHKSLDQLQKYIHPSEKTTREAYERVFEAKEVNESKEHKEELPESEKAPINASKLEKVGVEDRKMKVLNLYLEGKIEDDMLEKLLSIKGEYKLRTETRKCYDII